MSPSDRRSGGSSENFLIAGAVWSKQYPSLSSVITLSLTLEFQITSVPFLCQGMFPGVYMSKLGNFYLSQTGRALKREGGEDSRQNNHLDAQFLPTVNKVEAFPGGKEATGPNFPKKCLPVIFFF